MKRHWNLMTGAVFCVRGTEREDEETGTAVDGTGGIVCRPNSQIRRRDKALRLRWFEPL